MATRIICRAPDCIFWEDKLCTADKIVYDPEDGCLTYEILDDIIELEGDDDWDEEEEDELLDDDSDDDDDLSGEDDELYLDNDNDKWQF